MNRGLFGCTGLASSSGQDEAAAARQAAPDQQTAFEEYKQVLPTLICDQPRAMLLPPGSSWSGNPAGALLSVHSGCGWNPVQKRFESSMLLLQQAACATALRMHQSLC